MINVKKAYQFWYKSSELSTTQYIWIIAVSLKQATYFFFDAGYGHMCDFSNAPVSWKYLSDYTCKLHSIGDILGENAII